MNMDILKDLPPLKEEEALPLTSEELIKSKVNWDKLEEELGLSEGQPELILNLLASGVSPQEVAHAQGLSQGDMKSMIEHEEYVKVVRACITARHALNQSTNVLMDTIEHKALLKVSSSLEGMNPGEALATFKVINQAKRKDELSSTRRSDMRLDTLGKEEVELEVLPPTIPAFKLNAKGHIYEVDGRSMETIDAKALEILSKQQESKGIEYEEQQEDNA